MNEENNIQNLEEKRRQKAKSFTLNIQDDIYDESAKTENNEPEELNSYSGEDVKEQMAKNSKQALKKKKKIDKKLSKAKNKRNRRVFRVIWLVSVIIVGAMAGMFFVAGIDDMLAINRTEEKNVRIEIPANPNLDTVATVLEKNNIIDDKNYFKLFAKFTKADDDFTQGTYDIKTNLDYEAIINFLLSSVNRTDTVEVTIPEGRNVLEIAKLLKEKGEQAVVIATKTIELNNKIVEVIRVPSVKYEEKIIRAKPVIEYVTKEAVKIVNNPIYLNVCFDNAGVRFTNDLIELGYPDDSRTTSEPQLSMSETN